MKSENTDETTFEAISSNPRRTEAPLRRKEDLLVKYGLPMGNYGRSRSQLTPAAPRAILLGLEARLYEIARRTKGTDGLAIRLCNCGRASG